METERRHYPRRHMVLEVRSEDLGQSDLRTTDISLGGCYIETTGHVTVSDQIAFEIRLPRGDWMLLQGVVVYHHQAMGFGLRYTDLTEVQRNVLTQLIEGTGS
jgi:hypothetical protein